MITLDTILHHLKYLQRLCAFLTNQFYFIFQFSFRSTLKITTITAKFKNNNHFLPCTKPEKLE